MNIFRQLGWKLTFSYTLVTVSAFLVVTLIMGGIFFARIFISDSSLSPAGLTDVLLQQATPLWSHVLAQSPADTDLIRLLLKNLEGTVTTNNFLQIGGVRFSVNTILSFRALVMDTDGVLLGTSDPSFLPTCKVGEPFCVQRVPGLEAPLQAALAGETDSSRLFTVQESFMSLYGPTHRFTLAIPVFDQTDREKKQVLGVLVGIVDSFPTQKQIPAHLIDLAGKSLVIFLLGTGLMGAIFGAAFAHGLTTRFKRLSAATDLWSVGDFSTFIEDQTGDEVTQFSRRLNNMAQQLQGLLRRRQEMAVSEERNRLARDLHDSAKQQALAASFEVGTALTLFERDPQQARQHLIQADALVDAVRKELTNLVLELRPLAQDGQDFSETLKEYALDWAHRSGVVLNVDIAGDGGLSLEIRETLFRIAQEALANVARHSSARSTHVTLNDEPDTVVLKIKDDGCGFEPGTQHDGLGLRSMRERAEAFGGHFTLESAPGQGTCITVTLPKAG
jgi:signal transduction histidine kinase